MVVYLEVQTIGQRINRIGNGQEISEGVYQELQSQWLS